MWIAVETLLFLSLLFLPFLTKAEEQLILEADSSRAFFAQTLILDKTDKGGSTVLQFGKVLNERMLWDNTFSKFKLTDDLDIQGTASGYKLHFGEKLTGSGQVIFESSGSYLPGAIFVDVNSNGTGVLIDSAAHSKPLLALNASATGANAGKAAHLMFGYQNIFDTNLYRQSSNRLRTDDSLWVGGTLSGASLYSDDLNNSQAAATGSVLVARLDEAPHWRNHTGSMMWYIDGPLVTGTNQGPIVIMPFKMRVAGLDLKVKGAPSGAAIVVDVNEAGTSLFSTLPEVDDGSTNEDGNHAFSDINLAEGAEVTIDIDQVGSSTAGSGLTIMLHGWRQ